MTTRPTETPRWATGPASPNVDPGTTKRTAGFAVSEQPPAQEFNFMDNLRGEWIDYLRELNVSNWFDRAPAAATGEARWNGCAWADSSAPSGVAGVGVVVGGTVAGGGGNPTINSSTFGQRWTDRTSTFAATEELQFVHWAPGAALFIAGGARDDLETSPDGATWTLRTITGPTPMRGMDDNGQVAASDEIIGAGGTGEFMRSVDGTTWTFGVTGGVAASNAIAHNKKTGVDGLFVMVGAAGEIFTTPGGAPPVWTSRVSGTANALRGVVYDVKNQMWIAVGDSGTVIISSDGITWSAASAGPGGDDLAAVAVSPDGIAIAVGDPNTNDALVISMSKDGGDNWEDKTQEFGDRYFNVTYSANRDWLLVGRDFAGTSGVIITSLRSGT